MVADALQRLRVPAPALVLGSVISVQVGQAFGKLAFGLVGPMSVATLRLALAAAALLLVHRPALPRDRRAWASTMAFGTAIAGMNLIYPALAHLPLGLATSLQLLGPLTVALLASRRRRDLAWSILAVLGVGLFYLPSQMTFSLPGLLLALASGASMGTYLLLSRNAGARSADGSGLALAVAWAALVVAPFGVAESGTDLLQGHVLLAGLGLGLLSAVVPYSLDLAALRALPPRIVGTLESLEPVAAGLAGLVILQEVLAFPQWLAIGCITVASVGAVVTRDRSVTGPPPPERAEVVRS